MLRSLSIYLLIFTGSTQNIACVLGAKSTEKGSSEVSASGQGRQLSVLVGERERTYLVHLPKGYNPKKRYPMMLSFHGFLGNGKVQQRQSKMNEAADRHGFIVVYPDGTGMLGNRLSWNAGSCCAYAVREKVDDVGFVRALLNTLTKSYAIDERRICATGISNGGMMSYRLAAEMPERIAAIAPVAADLGVDGPVPKRAVPIIHFHGLKDTVKPINGGTGKYMGVKHRSILETIAWWVKANNCSPEPTAVMKEKDFTLTRYQPASGKRGAPIDFYTLPEGGHTWPGGEDVSASLGTGKLIKSVDASDLILRFCEAHPLR